MRNFWTIMRLELFLTWQSWFIRLIILAMLLLGALTAANNRSEPWASWSQFMFMSLVISIILIFTTGNQINRDRERRLDGIVLSTPITTSTYVLGKYLAALLSLLSLTGVSLLAALLMDRFYPWQLQGQPFLFFQAGTFPPLGPMPYLIGWLCFMLVPIIFGTIFIFAGITLTLGNRAATYIAALLFWFVLPLFAHDYIPDLLDITSNTFFYRYWSGFSPAAQLMFSVLGSGRHWQTPQFTRHIVQLSLTDIPPHFPSSFLWNRLFFLGISLTLLCLTIYGVHHTRRHA